MKNQKKSKLFALIFTSLFILTACNGGKEDMTMKVETYKNISDVPIEAWEKLNNKKIYFGHQSVGYDLIDGMQAVMAKNPQIKLNIVETSNFSDVKGGCFAHSRVGKNIDPSSKINGFFQFVESGLGNTADIAFFKFCFVDIHTGTDVNQVFLQYKEAMDKLSITYPKTRFIHMTVPLTTVPDGFSGVIKKAKDFIKSILGKINMYDNTVKQNYNDKLRDFYGKNGSLFDLALSEASYKNGGQLVTEKGGKKIQNLIPEYSNDGGHLNETGQYKVAEEFLLYLVNL